MQRTNSIYTPLVDTSQGKKRSSSLLKAINLFCNGSKPIGDIAFALGFYDLSSFTVQFKKTMSMTPLQHRKTIPMSEVWIGH
ncbi:MAG: helix-turn-helix domain-containing protein [Verrucomicrobiota bacterium]